ncbi:tetratricopeptide repeat protein [Streptomyces sp. TLI_171]|uniref:tetratricopeptide repeat protein n=1 Tax=Streptomyces sp. TLI_171 TaxID=1938859 RepID=UPI000C19255A|nr:tetratricopeptide repeat protein [Streptomyces sp. TLI_171]RKE22346.1 tetratricopeptide repeat protein [Streptomyces sp. TLI_171]
MRGRERELAGLRERVRVVREQGEARLPELVEALHRWCAALMGDRARAAELEAALVECVDAARRLARSRPEYLPGLAAALYRQSLVLGTQGGRSGALPVAGEAVGLYRELADEDGRVFGPPLAAALENLANQLAGVGARQEAVTVVREAVALRRRLADRHPDAERAAELASALADLGIVLGEAGRHEEALGPAREAVVKYRALGGGQGPERVAYWAALLSLAQELEHTGRRQERDRLLVEIGETRRRAARRNPELVAHLDAALQAGGYRVGATGLPERIGPPPPRDAPPADRPRGIAELTARGHAMAARGEVAGAVAAFREAAAAARKLPAEDVRARLTLAAVLHDLGLALGWAGRPAEAVPVLQESVWRYRALLASRGAPVRPLLAEALDTLGSRLAAVGRHREALAATREAVEVQEPAAEWPEAEREVRELGRMLNNLSIRYADLERHPDARDASRRSVARYREVASEEPDHLSGLVHALANLALREARLEHTGPVPALVRETIGLIDRPVRFPPGSQRAQLAESLRWLAWYLRRHRERGTARLAERAAARLES